MNKLTSSPAAAANDVLRARQWRWIVPGALLATLLLLAATTTGQEASPPATQPNNHAANASAGLITEGLCADGKLLLTTGKSAVLTTRYPYKRVSVGNPDVADVNPIAPTNVLVTAKAAGTTQLIVWDEADRSQVVDVMVEFDLAALQSKFDTLFPGHGVQVSNANGTLVLRGHVPSADIAQQMEAVAAPYGKVLNLMEVSGGQQVMLQVRFAEVSRSAVTALGVNGAYASGAFSGGSNIGQVNPTNLIPGEGSFVGDTPPGQGLILPAAAAAVNPSVTLYGAGQIGNFFLEYFINALRQNNLVRILAEPNLIAISGQEASFLAGGEFPIPVTQGGGTGSGGTAVTIEYREFGVRLNFTPVVLGDGRIRLKVSPEVSDLDFSTAVRFNGFVIPGLSSRKVTTVIELSEGQSFAIAGLLNNSVAATKDVTPLLGDLPVVGALFRSVRYQRKETELVVLVTPRLVEPMNPDQVATLPGEKWRHPTESDLFWQRDIGGEQTQDSQQGSPHDGEAPHATTQPAANDPAPRFRGAYGFRPATQPTASAAAQD